MSASRASRPFTKVRGRPKQFVEWFRGRIYIRARSNSLRWGKKTARLGNKRVPVREVEVHPVAEMRSGNALRRDLAGWFRDHLRELQWLLPLSVQAMLRTIAPGYNPYSDWNERYRAIFIHVPRTAGSSVALALGAPKPHIPISRFRVFEPQHCHEFFKFAFVRNPWDRLLSSFAHIRTAAYDPEWHTSHTALDGFGDFESFVLALENPKFRRRILALTHFRPQTDWITLARSNEIAVDFVGRFENLDEDYAIVADRLGISEPTPKVNASDHVPYREAYSRKMRDIVADVYDNSVALFGYQF